MARADLALQVRGPAGGGSEGQRAPSPGGLGYLYWPGACPFIALDGNLSSSAGT